MRRKLENIETIIATAKKVDLILITETWLQEPEIDFVNLKGYNQIHVTRADMRGGGGIAVYAKEDLSTELKKTINKKHQLMEFLIQGNGTIYNFILAYNPSTTNYSDFKID